MVQLSFNVKTGMKRFLSKIRLFMQGRQLSDKNVLGNPNKTLFFDLINKIRPKKINCLFPVTV